LIPSIEVLFVHSSIFGAMKKLAFFTLLILGLSCSKGDLQITAIDFESVTLQYCATPTVETQLLFKINDREALILQLAPGLLRNENSDGLIESNIPASSKLSYRIFNDGVASNYFCDLVPPAKPLVVEDLQAEVGRVRIETIQNQENPNQYYHTITLQGVSFVNSKGERLTNLSVEEFGILTTTVD
jgi:hypothetical protein